MVRKGKTKYDSRKKSRKLVLCEEFFERNEKPETSISKTHFCIEKKIARSTFVGWLLEYDKLKNDNNGNRKRTKRPDFPVIEKLVYDWFCEFKNAGNTCYFSQIVDQ